MDLVKYTDLPVIDNGLLAKLFMVEKIYVGNAVYSQDNESFNDVWDDCLILAYVNDADSPSEYNPSCGYTFRREGMPEVDTYFENGGKIKVIRATDNYGFMTTSIDALHLISATCTPVS